MNKVDLQITGMTCAACSARIEKVLLRMDGVKEAGVNLATASATVRWEGHSTDPDEIIGRIQKLGYGATRRVNAESGFQLEARDYRNRFLFALVLSVPLLTIMIGHWFEPLASVTPEFFSNAYFQLILGSILTSYAGYPFYAGAYQALKQGMPNMDVLVALSISAAYLYSQYHVFLSSGAHGIGHGHHDYYFDSIAMVLTSVTFGKWMEAIAKGNALRSLSSLYLLRAESATVVRPNGTLEQIPIKELRIGTLLSVATGEGIPTDGIVMDGMAEIEESLLTGEALLAVRKKGDRVYAGTRLASGSLVMRAATSPLDTLLSRVISFVEEAQQSKPRIQRRVDLIAAYFVPGILALAAATYVAWANLSTSAEAFGAAMAVLLVACPCALGLATPVSILIGSGLAARRGIIFKEGAMIETLSRADAFVFDKTGTLTEGKPVIADITSDRMPAIKLLKLAASLERHSDHPFAKAIVMKAQAHGLLLSPATEIEQYPGKGMSGVVEHYRIVIGHSHWLDELGFEVTEAERMDSKLHIVLQNRLSGSIGFRDPLREDAAKTISWLGSRGELWLATGDGESAAASIAAQAGIDKVKSRMLPEDKLALVHRLQKQGRIVAMVGDGVNDSAALAAANAGIAIAGGNDAALQSGDIVIVGGRMSGIKEALLIAKRTMRNIRQNLGLALFYNAIMIPLAAVGWLDPRTACVCMASSSVLVVGNSLRLKRVPIGTTERE